MVVAAMPEHRFGLAQRLQCFREEAEQLLAYCARPDQPLELLKLHREPGQAFVQGAPAALKRLLELPRQVASARLAGNRE